MKKIPVVVESVKFKLRAALQEVTVMFATDIANISTCAIRGIDTTVIVKNTYTQVNATLKEISVIDLNPLTIHNTVSFMIYLNIMSLRIFIQILSCTEGVALQVQVVLNNITDNTDKPDMELTVQGGELRIVFLNWFVANMLVRFFGVATDISCLNFRL